MNHSYGDLQGEYVHLWQTMVIDPAKLRLIDATVQKIIANKSRYAAVAYATHVPWFVVGVIHAMECGLRFDQHLHNGDPLARKTVQVPAGRPPGPGPWTWEQSAIDALQFEKLDTITIWSAARVAYALETFNGFGSRGHGVPSAYLWSYSNHYSHGKYIADHVWSNAAISGQAGGMPILKRLLELGHVNFGDVVVKPDIQADTKPLVKSKIAITASGVSVAGGAVTTADISDSLQQLAEAKGHLESIGLWEGIVHSFQTHKMIYIGLALVIAAGLIIYWRWRDHGGGNVAPAS